MAFRQVIPRKFLDEILDECGENGDRSACYRFVDRIVHSKLKSKEETDAIIQDFVDKGSREDVLWKLVDIQIEWPLRKEVGGRQQILP